MAQWAGGRVCKWIDDRGRRWGLHGVLLIGAGVALTPFGWALASTLGIAPRPWMAWVAALQAAPLARYLLNSLLVAGLTAGGQTVTAALAAYVFARLHFRGRDTLFVLFLGTLIVPNHVTMLPTFILLSWLGWLDSYLALIVPALAHPFGVFVLRQYFVTIPVELEDAALLDGSSRLGLLWHIFWPLSRPALATVGLLGFLWSWNGFLWPLIVLQTPGRYTLPIGLSLLRSELGTDWPVVMAATLMAATPVLLLFLITHRWLWRGLALTQYNQ